jgi:hypothetical protein
MDLRDFKLPELTDSRIINNYAYLMIACISIIIFRLTASNINSVLYDLLSSTYVFMPSNPYGNVSFYVITIVVTAVFDILSLLMLAIIVVLLIRTGIECVKILSDKDANP